MSAAQPRISSIENRMKALFDARRLPYKQQFVIDYYIVDFAFPDAKLAVECDGSYWHGNDRQRAKDRQKDGYLKLKGWTVIRLDEADIKAHPTRCLFRVIAALRSRSARIPLSV
jgi:very-short-patch-repair endonuclease